jgi:hypothetical protein
LGFIVIIVAHEGWSNFVKKKSIWVTLSMGITIAASLFFSPAANAALPAAHPDGWIYYGSYVYQSQCLAEIPQLEKYNPEIQDAVCVSDEPVWDLYYFLGT